MRRMLVFALLLACLAPCACAQFPGMDGPVTAAAGIRFSNLQALGSGGWSVAGGTSCCGGSNSGSSSNAWGIASPSLSGGSMSITSVYTGGSGSGYNGQMFTILSCALFPGASCLSVGGVTAEVHVYIPSSAAAPHALEGPNIVLYDGTDQEYPSLQCRASGTDWWIWNSAGAAWVDSGNSCAGVLATNTWHDIQAHYTISATAHTQTYNSVYVDGVSAGAFGQTYGGETYSSGVSLKAQVQLDGNESGPATTEVYYDGYSVSVTP